MTSIQNYRDALHNQASAYDAVLRPKPALMPADFYEINLRTDAPAAAVNTSLASLTRLLQSKSLWDLGVKPGRRMPIYVPGRGLTHITVSPKTRATIDIRAQNALPRAVITFSQPVRIGDPSNDPGSCVINALCDYQLERITIHPDHAVDLDGYLATPIPGIRRHWPKRVVEPNAGAQAPQKHSMIRLAVATAIAVLKNVPHPSAQAMAKNMASDAKSDDSGENLKMVESILPLLTPGTVRGESNVDASDKALVVRCDRADVLIRGQKYQHRLNAKLTPTREKVTVEIGEGTRLWADGLKLDMSGSISYDGRNVRGQDVQAQISQLSLVALINNGTPNQVLFPLYIDTTRAQHNTTVARVATNFSFGERMRLGGSVSFCLPAEIHDENRRLQSKVGTVVLEDARMQLVLKGDAAMGNQGSDYQLDLRVRQLAARGQVETQSAIAQAAMPWSIEGCKSSHGAAASDDPLHVTIGMHTQERKDQAGAQATREAGATIRSALPLRLGVPGKLHVQGPTANLDVHSAAMHVISAVRMGSHTHAAKESSQPRNDLEAHVDVRLLQFAGTVQTHALCFDAFQLPQAALWRLGTGHVATDTPEAPLGVLHADFIKPQGTPLPWRCTGDATFKVPAQFDGCPSGDCVPETPGAQALRQRSAKLLQLPVEAQGGPLQASDLSADLACERATFDITPAQRIFSIPIVAQYLARVAGQWQAHVGLDTREAPTWSTWPKALPTWHAPGGDTDSEASYQTASEGEDALADGQADASIDTPAEAPAEEGVNAL